MPERADTGVFLERRSYRRRRLIDGLKLLPFLGAWLFLIPVFWPGDGSDDPEAMSHALHYVFGSWMALIVACALLVTAIRRLSARDDGETSAGNDVQDGQERGA